MKYLLMGLIRVYQWTISPLLGPICKYYPSCSHYGFEAMRTHGAVKGSFLTAWRILRCNPWSAGGVDHVPPRTAPPWHRRLAALVGKDRAAGGVAVAPLVEEVPLSEPAGPEPDNAVGTAQPCPASAPKAQGA